MRIGPPVRANFSAPVPSHTDVGRPNPCLGETSGPGLHGVCGLQAAEVQVPTTGWTQLAALTGALAESMAEACPGVTCAGTGREEGDQASGVLAEAQGRAGRGFLEQAVGQQAPKDRVFPEGEAATAGGGCDGGWPQGRAWVPNSAGACGAGLVYSWQEGWCWGRRGE